MMNKRKLIFNITFLILVFSITIFYIFHDQDISSILDAIQTADIKYWLYAILFVVFFLLLAESFINILLMKSIKQNVKPVHCLLYSFIGFSSAAYSFSIRGTACPDLFYEKG